MEGRSIVAGACGRMTIAVCIAAFTACAFTAPTRAQSIADFYRGKTIQMLIGGSPGVSYDFVGRAVAQHMSRHIPGNPGFVVENMPGAGSLTMTNHLYNVARRDGTVIGMPNTNVIFEPTLKLLSRDGGAVQFDLEKFIWLGTPVQEPQIMLVSRAAPATTLAQMKTTKVVFGASNAGTDNYMLPNLVNRLWGTQIETVLGYKSPADIFIALDRGEVQGVSAAQSTLMVNRSNWIRDNKVAVIMQFGFERVRDLPDTPTALEQSPNPEASEMLRFIATKFSLARPFVLPPGTPADRADALRKAYDETIADPEFLTDMGKLGVEIRPVDGPEMTRLIHNIQIMPARTVEQLRALMQP